MSQYYQIGHNHSVVLEINEPVLDRMEEITGTKPKNSIFFIERKPLIKTRSSLVLVEEDKGLEIVYNVYANVRINDVPPHMRYGRSFIEKPENIEKILNGRSSSKLIEIYRYDKQKKVESPEYTWLGFLLSFSIVGNGKGTVSARTAHVEDIYLHNIPMGGQYSLQPALNFIAGSDYKLPSGMFIDISDEREPWKIKDSLEVGIPNQKAVDEIVNNLLPKTITQLKKETRRLVLQEST